MFVFGGLFSITKRRGREGEGEGKGALVEKSNGGE